MNWGHWVSSFHDVWMIASEAPTAVAASSWNWNLRGQVTPHVPQLRLCDFQAAMQHNVPCDDSTTAIAQLCKRRNQAKHIRRQDASVSPLRRTRRQPIEPRDVLFHMGQQDLSLHGLSFSLVMRSTKTSGSVLLTSLAYSKGAVSPKIIQNRGNSSPLSIHPQEKGWRHKGERIGCFVPKPLCFYEKWNMQSQEQLPKIGNC